MIWPMQRGSLSCSPDSFQGNQLTDGGDRRVYALGQVGVQNSTSLAMTSKVVGRKSLHIKQFDGNVHATPHSAASLFIVSIPKTLKTRKRRLRH